MKITRFILPASIAAAIHAALLLAVPKLPAPAVITAHHVRIERHPPKPVDEPPPEPPADLPRADQVAPVKHGTEAAVLPEPVVDRDPARVPIEVQRTVFHPRPDAPPGPPGLPTGTGTEITSFPPTILAVDGLDRIPRTTAQIPPNYPAAMRSAGIGGEVLVEFTVDSTGRVMTARVVKSTRGDFEEPAVRAVLKWRFEPGKRNGHPVPFRMAIPIKFSLEAF